MAVAFATTPTPPTHDSRTDVESDPATPPPARKKKKHRSPRRPSSVCVRLRENARVRTAYYFARNLQTERGVKKIKRGKARQGKGTPVTTTESVRPLACECRYVECSIREVCSDDAILLCVSHGRSNTSAGKKFAMLICLFFGNPWNARAGNDRAEYQHLPEPRYALTASFHHVEYVRILMRLGTADKIAETSFVRR